MKFLTGKVCCSMVRSPRRLTPWGDREKIPHDDMLLCIAFEVKAEMVVALAGDVHFARRG